MSFDPTRFFAQMLVLFFGIGMSYASASIMTLKRSERMSTSRPSPEDKSNAPDTARVYERAKPELESGMGRLDNNEATPASQPDQMSDAVPNKQPPRQINAEEEEPSRPGNRGRK